MQNKMFRNSPALENQHSQWMDHKLFIAKIAECDQGDRTNIYLTEMTVTSLIFFHNYIIHSFLHSLIYLIVLQYSQQR